MMSKVRALAAVLVAVTLVAGLPLTCVCAPGPSPAAAEHSCCEPPLGLQQADDGCCGAGSVDLFPGAPPVVGPTLDAAACAAELVSAPFRAAPRSAPVVAPPPRFVVLRI